MLGNVPKRTLVVNSGYHIATQEQLLHENGWKSSSSLGHVTSQNLGTSFGSFFTVEKWNSF